MRGAIELNLNIHLNPNYTKYASAMITKRGRKQDKWIKWNITINSFQTWIQIIALYYKYQTFNQTKIIQNLNEYPTQVRIQRDIK
jgi:hypothetical protein